MSLFRAVRSLVGLTKDNGQESTSSGSQKKKTVLDQALQQRIDKVKGMWTLYANISVESERNLQLLKLLPRFVCVYKDKEFSLVQETFGEKNLKQFAIVVSKKLVKDVKETWKPKESDEINAKSVLKMLASSDDRAGFESLKSLEISCNSTTNIDVATDAGVPSMLVKLIQLTFALPPGSERGKEDCIRSTMSLLGNIVPFRSVLSELLGTDSLHELFQLISKECASHNLSIKDTLLGIISTIVTLHTDRETIDYFHAKSSIRYQVKHMKMNLKLFSPEYTIEAWKLIILWMKQSCSVSDCLTKEFQSSGGYDLFQETLQWIETKDLGGSLVPDFLEVITTFVYVGRTELELPDSNSPYNNHFFSEVTPSSKENIAVRNISACEVLQSYFLKSGVESSRIKALDCILSIYASNYSNFLHLQQLHTLCHFIGIFESLSFELKDSVLRVVSYVVTVVNYVPFQELSSLSCLLQPSTSSTTVVLIFQLISKLVTFDKKYKLILQEAGLLHMLLSLLREYQVELISIEKNGLLSWKQWTEESTENQLISIKTYTVAMDCITLLLNDVPENIYIFRTNGSFQTLLLFLYNNDTRTAALRVIQELIDAESIDPFVDIDALIEIMQVSPSENENMKQDILHTLQRCLLATGTSTRDAFRESGGFECLVSLLMGQENVGEGEAEFSCALIKTIFRTITTAIMAHPLNREYIRSHITFSLCHALAMTTILASKGMEVLEALLAVATENLSPLWEPEKLLVFNPEFLRVIFELFPAITTKVRVDIMAKILDVITRGKKNQEPLCSIGLLEFVLTHFTTELQDASDPLHVPFLTFIEELAAHRISPMELRTFIGLMKTVDDTFILNSRSSLLGSMVRMTQKGFSPPYVEMDLDRCGYACLYLPSFGERSWPPANGHTFLSWIYIERTESENILELFSFISEDGKSTTSIYMKENSLCYRTSQKHVSEFPLHIEFQKWYHLAIVHTRPRFQPSEVKLYINGEIINSAKLSYIQPSSTKISAYIGTSPQHHRRGDSIWRAGPCYLLEEVISWNQILLVYCLGPRYCGTFQVPITAASSFQICNSRVLKIVQSNDPSSSLGILDLPSSNIQIPEERIIFALNASNVMAASKLHSHFLTGSVVNVSESLGEGDADVIIRNSVGVGSKAASLLGGSLAVESGGIFSSISKIGGIQVILLLIEVTDSTSGLVDALEILNTLVQQNPHIAAQMQKLKGYALLGLFLRSKQSLIDKRVLDKIFELTGVIPSVGNEPVIINMNAFRQLILHYPIWKWTSEDVQKLYFRRLNQLLVNNEQAAFNVNRLRRLHTLPKLLTILEDELLDISLLDWIGNVITNLMAHQLEQEDLHALTSFLISTLDDSTIIKKPTTAPKRKRSISLKRKNSSNVAKIPELSRKMLVRNLILEMIANLLIKLESYNLFLKEITPNWIFLFIDKTQHHTTVTLSLKILVLLLQQSTSFVQKFTSAGGFHVLEEVLPHFAHCTSVYYLLIALFVGKSPALLPVNIASLQLTYSDLFITFKAPEFHLFCNQAMKVLLAILRKCCGGTMGSTPFLYTHVGLSSALYNSVSKQLKSSPNRPRTSSALASLLPDVSIPSQNQSPRDSLPNQAMKLNRWVISDQDIDIQKAIIQFIKYLFDNCTEFQDLLWHEKNSQIVRSMVLTLFPFDTLNYPCDTSIETEDNKHENSKKEEEKCHISATYLFDLLAHFLVTANSHQGKVIHLLERMFESPPMGIAESHVLLFQTKLIRDFIHFGDTSVSQQLFQQNRTVAVNLTKFCSLITDRICAGLLPSVSQTFFDFLISILERVEGRKAMVLSDDATPKTIPPSVPKGKMKAEIQSLYKCLNRVTIYILYAPYGKAMEDYHTNMRHVIESIITHQHITLNLWNNDSEFIYVLCHFLHNFLLDEKQLRDSSMHLWKLLLLTKHDIMNEILIYTSKNEGSIDLRTEGFDLLLKPSGFDLFTMWLSNSLKTIHDVLTSKADGVWFNYIENEGKAKDECIKQLKVTQAEMLRKRAKKKTNIRNSITTLFQWRIETINSEQEKNNRKNKKMRQEDVERMKFMKILWKKQRKRLTRERSVWGPLLPNPLAKFKLDKTEGPFRMRKKEKENLEFYKHYPFVRGLPVGHHSIKIPTSLDCRAHYDLHGGYSLPYPSSTSQSTISQRKSLNTDLSITPTTHTPKARYMSTYTTSDGTTSDSDSSSSSIFYEESDMIAEEPYDEEIGGADQFIMESEESDDELFSEDEESDKIQRIIGSTEKLFSVYNCERVEGMIKKMCILLVCSQSLFCVDNYQVIDGDIIEIEPSSPCTEDILSIHHTKQWAYKEIRDVFKRRYLLCPVALELFSRNGRNVLIVFEPTIIEEVYRSLSSKISKSSHTLEDISGNQIGTLLSVAEDTRFNVIRFWKKDITQKWIQGDISNFQYLMHVNMLAGRSYNDLTQYPIFPWVLSDYTSEEIQLEDPSVYRDLSKPMGNLSPGRAEEFTKRYTTWIPRENEGVPKWHYGSHYSSAGIVLYYLIRQEPFTQQFLNHLQSGRFDVADRLFHSIQESWASASGATMNMSDVKELIPEFYYLPEFLQNRNKFDLGKKQTNEVLDHVVLPPWAKGDPLEFIRIHRLALESEYVSRHLHEWIDLIFGYKQQGKEAEAALNVFYYLTYEGSVDIDAIEDPVERDSVLAQINNFGQTPQQLFKKAHPQRQVTSPVIPSMMELLNTSKLERSVVKEIGVSVRHIQVIGDRLIATGRKKICFPSKACNEFIAWGFLDFSIRVSSIENEKVLKVFDSYHEGHVSCLCSTPDGSYIITGGSDSLIVVRTVKQDRTLIFLQALSGHFSPITCIAVSRSYSSFISASEDNTVILWDLNRLSFVKTLELPCDITSPISILSINDITGNIVAVAGSCLLIWTINGHLIATGKTPLSISAFAMTAFNDWSPCEYITGHSDGSLKVWNIKRIEGQSLVVQRTTLKAHFHSISCIHISSDGKRIYTGDSSGKVFQLYDGSTETKQNFV